ncbi:MAG: hypothetical protein IOD05_17670 [Rhodobacter sp.]|nr:hypothetical protein [Rhodobacter sp.]
MSVFLSPLAGAGAQFFDNNGNPLAGGKLWTYQAGTTTPQAVYTASDGSTPHTNPIILDAYGRPPEEIWLTQGQAYKFVLMTSLDVVLGTYDDISGVNDFSIQGNNWSDILGTPTTLSGYGITDAYTKTASDAKFAPINNPTFTGTPLLPDNAPSSTNYPVGYRDAPQVSKTTNYTLIESDAAKSVLMNGTSLTLTVPANSAVAFPIGTVAIVVNVNTTALSISITTDTMTLANSTTTGTRTLARNGVATLIKIAATSWLISGAGLT